MSVTRPYHPPVKLAAPAVPVDFEVDEDDYDEEDFEDYALEDEAEHHNWLLDSTATKFLLAGGIAGAGWYIASNVSTRSLTPR